jgi:hypothetical protein
MAFGLGNQRSIHLSYGSTALGTHAIECRIRQPQPGFEK